MGTSDTLLRRTTTNMKAFIALSCLLAVAVAEPWGFGAWGGNSGLRTVYPSTTYSGINTYPSTRYSGLKTYPSTMYNSLNTYPSTMYSGLNTYPNTMYSGLNTYPTVYNGPNTYNGHFNTGLTHIVKREADAEPTHYRGWGRRSFSGRTYPSTMYSGLNTYNGRFGYDW